MKLYIPSAKHNAINKRVIIPPNEVVYFSFDLYLNEYETSLKKVIFDTFSHRSYMIYKNLLFGR